MLKHKLHSRNVIRSFLLLFIILLPIEWASSANETISATYYATDSNILSGAYVSGATNDLVSNDGVYMTFRSYASATSAQILYTHQETTTIGGTSYNQLGLSSADFAGTTLSVSAGTMGRKLMGEFVYQLSGVSSIPASTWTIYYRAYRSSFAVAAHGDVDILIRMSNGTLRTTIATNVANSGAIGTSWSTVSGTYSWTAYAIIDQTDYLEIDYYTEVTTSSFGASVNLRIDDRGLAADSQTRATDIYLPSEYTSEVEFTGSSNMGTWTQLAWNVDSAWTNSSVIVTILLYNYALGGYPISGDGYYSYTSNSIANTDETGNQTITTNPSNFRDGSGNWKIKVKGVKTTTAPFYLKADWVELNVEVNLPPVLNPIGNKNVDELSLLNFIATASDPNNDTLTFSLGAGAPAGASINTTTGVFTWTPSEEQGPGVYTLRVVVSDGSLTDYEDISVTVSEVLALDLFWIILPACLVAFGLLLFLVRKRKKRSPKAPVEKKREAKGNISKEFRITQQMMGKKMLLEIDPKSDYHNALVNVISERSGETCLIITTMNSELHSEASKKKNARLFLLSRQTSSAEIISNVETVLPAADLSIVLDAIVKFQRPFQKNNVNLLFDNISDIILTCGFEKTYKFMRYLLEAISSPNTTALFVFNPAAHEKTVSSSIRGLFQTHLAYPKQRPKSRTQKQTRTSLEPPNSASTKMRVLMRMFNILVG